MKISQFYDLFKSRVPACRILQNEDSELYSFKPYSTVECLEDNILYVAHVPENGAFPDDFFSSGQSFLLSGSSDRFEAIKQAEKNPKTNILFVSGTTLAYLFSVISDIFLIENRFTAQLNDLYVLSNSGSDLQAIVDKAHEIIKCPVLVMDNRYRIMAISLGTLEDDRQGLNSQREMGNITEDNLRRMRRDKVYEKLRLAPGRMLYGRAPDSDIWWVNMLITVHGIEVAEVGIQEIGRKFDDYDFRLCRFLQKMIAIEMQRNSYLHSNFGASHAILLRELLERRFVSEEIVDRRASLLGWKSSPYYFIMTVYAFGRGDNVSQKTYEIFVHRLLTIFPQCRWRITDENLVLLIPRPNNAFSFFRDLTDLSDILKNDRFHAFLSNPFSSLMDVQKAYRQTTAIYNLRGVIRNENPVYFYIDYTLLHMADLLRESHDLSDFCHPYILDIYNYDRENGTEFLKTLKEYLTNINNPGMCAANLHIHKNTLYYRINKISDVFDLDLSNGDLRMRLQLSLELLKISGIDA